MKKFYTLALCALATVAANAQIVLTGTTYTQNFDTIASGIPNGWHVDTNATATHLGGPAAGAVYYAAATGTYYDTTDCASDIFSHGFKNSASADGGTTDATMTCAQQTALSNRALSVRQSSSWGDPGASFQLELANTTGFHSFVLAFKLQGLDILSSRVNTWTVDYGIGATPTTFTAVTPTIGYMMTGANHFTDTAVAINFGTALDNQSQPVWIRISTLSKSTGSGNRTTVGIDDFVLSYSPSGVQTINGEPIVFKTLGMGTQGNANFTCSVAQQSEYTLAMYDITGRMVCSKTVNLAPGAPVTLQAGNGSLVAGMYIARLTNGTTSAIAKVIVQ